MLELGDIVKVGHTSYAISEARWVDQLDKNPVSARAKPDAAFLIMRVWVRNDDARKMSIPQFRLIDENGRAYDRRTDSRNLRGSLPAYVVLKPSRARDGLILFDVPLDHRYELKLLRDVWTSEHTLVAIQPR
jgi:hypothetical protein